MKLSRVGHPPATERPFTNRSAESQALTWAMPSGAPAGNACFICWLAGRLNSNGAYAFSKYTPWRMLDTARKRESYPVESRNLALSPACFAAGMMDRSCWGAEYMMTPLTPADFIFATSAVKSVWAMGTLSSRTDMPSDLAAVASALDTAIAPGSLMPTMATLVTPMTSCMKPMASVVGGGGLGRPPASPNTLLSRPNGSLAVPQPVTGTFLPFRYAPEPPGKTVISTMPKTLSDSTSCRAADRLPVSEFWSSAATVWSL